MNKTQDNQIENLRRLYRGNSEAKAILDYFASRERNAAETKVETLEAALAAKGNGYAYYPIMKALKNLASMGYGKFVSGRKGGKTRVVWRVAIVSLGRVAAGVQSEVEWLGSGDVEVEAVRVGEPAVADNRTARMKRVVYPLRPDTDAELLIPKDFAKKDADRLIDFIKTLPFDGPAQ